ncbi:hypothetical protein GCM10010493_74560 [Streptomyces lavendulae subsp. grasserius]
MTEVSNRRYPYVMARLPTPPPPTVPATAEKSISATSMKVRPRTSGPSASGTRTVSRMRSGPAPIERAASMTPGSTESRFDSTIRAIPKVATIVMGKTAASVPIIVPTTARVTGARATMAMMKGTGRMTLMNVPSTACTTRFGRTPPLRVA